MNKIVFWGLLALVITGPAGAVKQLAVVRYSKKEELKDILSYGRLDVLKIKPGYGVECLADDSELAVLKDRGCAVDVIIDDVIAYYRKIKSGYKSDSFGPYYSYAEAVAEMNSLHAQYPSLVSAPESLGAGWEGRPVWAFKVSNSPASDNGKPGVLYTGVHHAREPITVTITLGFARYLCQNYSTDPGIKTLVDNRQIWFIPVVNPDGYVFNQTYSDSLWRKNRRNNGDGSYGVDVNRNYPYMWGYDNSGSSPTPSYETYRGPSAGSEPEVQAVMGLMIREGYFKTALNYHSYSNLWIYPWGYASIQAPDSSIFRDISMEIAAYNGYAYGTSWELLYNTNGDSDDWMYGEELDKPRCFAFTPEVGEDFWQADTAGIVEQFNENLIPNIMTAQAAGAYPVPTGKTSIAGGDGDTLAESGELLDLSLEVKNRALDAEANGITGTLGSNDPYMEIKQAAGAFGDISALATKYNTVPFTISIDTVCPAGHAADFEVKLKDTEGSIYPGQVRLSMTGGIDTIFHNEVEAGIGDWTHSGSGDLWHITTHSSHTPSHSWYCGNEGSWVYSDDMNCRLVSGPITAKRYYTLSFWHRYGLELDWDYGYVEVSTDNGATWILAGPRFNGTSGWTKHTIDLSAYSETIRLGFRLNSDSYVTDEGWYLDDIVVTGDTSSNRPPGKPLAVSPSGGAIVPDSLPYLTVSNASDTNGDLLSYGFNIYSDSLLTSIYAQGKNVASGSGSTSWQLTKALVPGHYWWRAYAEDGKERGLFCDKAHFSYDPDGIQGDPDSRLIPKTFFLEQGYPNPSRGRVEITYQLPRSGAVQTKIYNVSGQLVRVLEAGPKPAGYHAVRWDGRDDQGQNLGSGIYFCKLQTEGLSATQRLTVIR
ncbi:T9SS type A sorting domain-containing protein [candidate division TA06 bacterium]|nr:T9SS type A sorting domain-containing protein [candidate division TA06 bacterium]